MNSEVTRKVFWAGGLIAGVLLVALGAIWIWQGASARSDVQDTLAREQIVGSPDMSRATFEAGAQFDDIELPTCDISEKEVTSGSEARCFSEWLRIHVLDSTAGKSYTEMGRFLDADGNDVFVESDAAVDPQTGRPVANGLRDLWITQRALATGLELAYIGDQLSWFSIASGVIFMIIGIGLLVILTIGGVLGPTSGKPEEKTADSS